MTLTTLILLPLATALFAFVAGRRRLRLIEAVSVLSTVVLVALASVMIFGGAERVALGALGNLLYLDSFGALLVLIISFVGCNTALYSVGYLRAEVAKGIIGPRRVWQYWFLFHLFLFAMLLSVCAKSPMIMWAAIEATTLSTVFLVSFYNKKSSLEAGWKYLVVNSVGLLIGFFGTLTLLSTVSSTHTGLLSWHELITLAPTLDPLTAKVAFIFILIGYGTKAGLVPMHTWLPDAHGKAPAPISALLSGVLLNTAFLAIARYKVVVDASVGPWWAANVLLVFGVLSVLLMGFMLLHQNRYKRLLAYSSIENMGIIAVGFGVGGLGIFYAVFHMVYHALVKSALFLTSGNLFLAFSSGKIRNVRGALTALPFTGPLLFLGLIAVVGMPPFGLFVSKLGILSVGIGAHPVLVALLLLGFGLVFVGFLTHGTKMLFGTPPSESPENVPVARREQSVLTVLPIVILLATAFVLSVYIPQPLAELFENATMLYSPQL